MKANIAYLKYIIRHKWYVYLASKKVGVSFWRALVHDWTKLLPSEWKPYRDTFYKEDGTKQYKPTTEFEYAWNAHQKRNKHHWQYWLITFDKGNTEFLEMPEVYVREMVADWIGAGWAITGDPNNVHGWYESNNHAMKLSIKTRAVVERILGDLRLDSYTDNFSAE